MASSNLDTLFPAENSELLVSLALGTGDFCFFSTDASSPLTSPITVLYRKGDNVVIPGFSTFGELIERLDRSSQVCELHGREHYLERILDNVRSVADKLVHFYLPILDDNHQQIPLKVSIRNENDKTYVLLKVSHETELSYETLVKNSYKDSMTGLFNGRALEVHLNQMKDRRFLGFMDLNGLKGINDTHGHEVGDVIIELVGSALIACSNDHVIFYRKGGDEFVFMTVDLNYREVMKLVSRINSSVKNISYRNIPVSLSIGVASYDDTKGDVPTEVLSLADLGMYKAKKAGLTKPVYISHRQAKKIKAQGNVEELIEKLSAEVR